MILIKVLTKTKYLSFHFAFICSLCAVLFAAPLRKNPSFCNTNNNNNNNNIIKQGEAKIQYAFVFEYLKF